MRKPPEPDVNERSDFIPNSYQTPNLYADRYMALLTPEEWVVLSYTARRIFGWHKHQDRISLGQYTTGWVQQGRRRDYGTGLSIPAIRHALDALKQYGLIVEHEAGDPKTRTPALYSLQLDNEKVDTAGLERRAADRREHGKRRTRKARATQETTRTMQSDYTDTMQSDYTDTMQSDYTDLSSPTTQILCSPTDQDYAVPLHDKIHVQNHGKPTKTTTTPQPPGGGGENRKKEPTETEAYLLDEGFQETSAYEFRDIPRATAEYWIRKLRKAGMQNGGIVKQWRRRRPAPPPERTNGHTPAPRPDDTDTNTPADVARKLKERRYGTDPTRQP